MKWIEEGVRKFGYFIFRMILRNKEVQLPLDASKIKKILILRYDVLGDMIVTTPVFNLLKDKIPNVEIHVVASKRNVGLLAHDSRVSKVICYYNTFVSLLKVRREARRENYDFILPLVFYKTTKAGLWANWVGKKKSIKIGWVNPWRSNFYRHLFNVQIPSNPTEKFTMTMSEIQVNLLCTSFGWEYSKDLVKLGIHLSSENEEFADKYFSEFSSNCKVIVNISARENRTMPEENLVQLVQSMIEEFPNIQLFINAVQQDFEKAIRIASISKEKVHLLPFSSDVLNLCSLIKKADAVITPDTAIVHIAAAFNVPLVAMFPNSERICTEWGPQHDKAIIVVPDGEKLVSEIEPFEIIKAFSNLSRKFNLT